MPHDWKSDWKPGRSSGRNSDWHSDDSDHEEFGGKGDVEDCPHCGETIYDDSEQCPRCGTYLNEPDQATDSQPRRNSWLIIIGVLLCLAVFAMWIVGRNW